jgi:hypothetical protein
MRRPETPHGGLGYDPSAELLAAHDNILRFTRAVKRAEALKKKALSKVVEIWEQHLGETYHLQGEIVARAAQAPDDSFYTRRFMEEGEPSRRSVIFNSSPLVAVIGTKEFEPKASSGEKKSITPRVGEKIESSVFNVLVVKLSQEDRLANFSDLEYVYDGDYLGLDIESLTL